jgi:hypothetical protein
LVHARSPPASVPRKNLRRRSPPCRRRFQ